MTANEFRRINAYGSIRNYTHDTPRCENCKWHTESFRAIKYSDVRGSQGYACVKEFWCKAYSSRGFITFSMYHCNAWEK